MQAWYKIYLINSLIFLILLLSGMIQGNLKNLIFSPNVCMVVCFVFKIKVVLSDDIFCQSLSLAVGLSSEGVTVVIFHTHGCIRLLWKLGVLCILFLCFMLCGSNLATWAGTCV